MAAPKNKLRIVLDNDRRLARVECEDFMIKFNGMSNQHYRDVLAPLGIDLVFLGATPAPELSKKES